VRLASGDQAEAFHVVGNLTGAGLTYVVDCGAIIAKDLLRAEHCASAESALVIHISSPFCQTNL
jgi:hypothetical protein